MNTATTGSAGMNVPVAGGMAGAMSVLPKPTPGGCGCDDVDNRQRLISVDAALSRIAHQVPPVTDHERLPLWQATGRTLAKALRAQDRMPRFDHSAMDGYALNAADLRGQGPWLLPVHARHAAGEMRAKPLDQGTAARIFTGAPLPDGADCVVMQEKVARKGDSILLKAPPATGDNIRKAGEEHEPGDEILPLGSLLTPRAIAAAAAAGAGELEVRRRVRVVLLVSGAEIVASGGHAPTGGQIWDVNTPMMRSVLDRPDIELVRADAIPDDLAATSRALAQAAETADLIVTTGGVSVGEEDHLPAAMGRIGGRAHFTGVAIKPGKPVTFATIGDAFWLGLPGNPQSAFVTWMLFGEAILRHLCGRAGAPPDRRYAALDRDLVRKPGRREYRPAALIATGPTGHATITCCQRINSGQVSGLARADGLAILPERTAFFPKGTLVEFLPFHERLEETCSLALPWRPGAVTRT